MSTAAIAKINQALIAERDAFYFQDERQPELQALQKQMAAKFEQTKVLEIACSNGFWTQFIAQTAHGMVAIDADPEALKVAERRVPEGRVKFVEADAFSVPTNLGHFSAAFAGLLISTVPRVRRVAFFKGLSAVLVPGAEVMLVDTMPVADTKGTRPDTDADGNSYRTVHLPDGGTLRELKNYPTESELVFALGSLGVRPKMTHHKHFWTFEYVAA